MAENPTVKLGVLISGSGTNLQAIIDAIVRGDLKAEIRLVISNRADAQGLERARRHGIETAVIDHRNFRSREDFDRAVVAALQGREVELVALRGLHAVAVAGDARRVSRPHHEYSPQPAAVLSRNPRAEGRDRIWREDRGCTVFFVTPGVDDGPVIVQAVVPVLPGDDEQRLRGAHPAAGASHLPARDRVVPAGPARNPGPPGRHQGRFGHAEFSAAGESAGGLIREQ